MEQHLISRRVSNITLDGECLYCSTFDSNLETGIVRRELSDNFVYYSQSNYDDLSSAAEWAQESLQLHTSDERDYVYDLDEFVNAETHDDLWNAAQLQLVTEGQMHGFVSEISALSSPNC
jgi:deoxyribodipyrimidine photo-lyase